MHLTLGRIHFYANTRPWAGDSISTNFDSHTDRATIGAWYCEAQLWRWNLYLTGPSSAVL